MNTDPNQPSGEILKMGKTQKSKCDNDKTPGRKLQPPTNEIALLFLKKKTICAESKMAPAQDEREEKADSNRELSEADSEGEDKMDIQSYITNFPSKTDIK